MATMLAFVGAGSLLTGLLLICFMITAGFKKIKNIEGYIATEGKYLDHVRRLWGAGPIGRWMRLLHVFSFFALQAIPGLGTRMAARLGDEAQSVPLSLRLWAIVPMSLIYTLAIIVVICGWKIGAYR
ncbi:hypothetical protein [Marinobacter bohaiensis]|uniref:hypothetical protein n=1 Tax=Marinobacter bohaiensis TaxID=2201898 RepID=UPI000DAD7C5E|nr:hypothetical protein [Marinobacter bohaiensis]